jgi:hypothetical protein
MHRQCQGRRLNNGTKVEIYDRYKAGRDWWFWIEINDSSIRGWVPQSQLICKAPDFWGWQ